MSSFSFLVNARGATVEGGYVTSSQSGGFLFPPHRSTAAVRDALARRRSGYVLSDNGLFDDIGRIAGEVEARMGKDPVGVDGIAEVRHMAKAALREGTNMFSIQEAVRPDGLIGPEDITLACWIRVGVPEAGLRARRREIARRNSVVAERAMHLATRLPGKEVFAVASAHDYDSALDAGMRMAAAGVTHVAMGFGAFMADASWSDSVKYRGRVRRLPASLPSRYLRVGLVARGVFDGLASRCSELQRFHYLGLGAPIMLPLAALATPPTVGATLDATSPIKDAVDGTLYVSKPAALKVKSWNVAERLSTLRPSGRERSHNGSWDCPCRFCQAFMEERPLDLEAARLARESSGHPVVRDDLLAGNPVGDALPFFRIGRDDAGQAAERARIGHNHWVLGTLARSLDRARAAGTPFEERIVQDYNSHANTAATRGAVTLAFKIAREGL